jgi:hypothetical protein
MVATTDCVLVNTACLVRNGAVATSTSPVVSVMVRITNQPLKLQTKTRTDARDVPQRGRDVSHVSRLQCGVADRGRPLLRPLPLVQDGGSRVRLLEQPPLPRHAHPQSGDRERKG